MLLRHLCALGILLVSVPGASHALTTIDFNTLPGGGTPTVGAFVGDTYASLGVHFGSSLEVGDQGTARWRAGNVAGDFRIWDSARAAVQQVGFHILATFDQDVSYVSFDVVAPTGGAAATMKAYDLAGLELASVQMIPAFTVVFEDIGAIRAVSVVGPEPFGSSPFLDNLTFEMVVVPEPSSIALVGFGLGLVVAGRRARREA